MDTARGRRAAGFGHDHGVEHQLPSFAGTLRRRHLLFSQAAHRHGRGGRGFDCLLDSASGAAAPFRLSAARAELYHSRVGFDSRHRREPRRRAPLDHVSRLRVSAFRIGQTVGGRLSGSLDGQERGKDPHFRRRRLAAFDGQRRLRRPAPARARFRHRPDSDHGALFHAVHRRSAREPPARHRAVGAAGAGVRGDDGRIPPAPAAVVFGSLERPRRQRLSCRAVADRFRLRSVARPRPRREPPEAFVFARGAHRFRLLGDRRGVGFAWAPWPCSRSSA